MAGRNRLACFGAREKGTCGNHLTIRRDEVEARVLKALAKKLLNQELFEEFCEEFTREMNRLRMEHRASLSAAEREIERIENRLHHVSARTLPCRSRQSVGVTAGGALST
jgi:site-specific DNA recombinase